MKGYLLRRRKLGNGSTKGIVEASKEGITVIRNDATLPTAADLICIRWGCTSSVPQNKIWNRAPAIHKVANKKDFRLLLAANELAVPAWGSYTAFQNAPSGSKWVVRPALHAQGKKIWAFTNKQEMKSKCATLGDYYISEFFDKKEEYRVFVAFGRAVWVAKKTPADPNALAWNVAQGGTFENVRWGEWPIKAVAASVEAMKHSDLDFGGVDVMVDANGKLSVLEINSAPSQTSPYRQSCVAKVFDYHLKNNRHEHYNIGTKGKYLRYIHPALDSGANLA